MTSESKVYIAGIGSSPSPPGGSPAKGFIASLVSAATKALLDAGVTYDDVARSVTSTRGNTFNYGSEAAKAFHEGTIAVDEVESGSEFNSAFYWVRDRGAQCVLMIAAEKSAAVAIILVSDTFLRSHPYLKDSAALIRESDAPRSKSEGQPREEFYDFCQMVWALRGWSHAQGRAGREGRLYYWGKKSQSFELSRADAKTIPEWKETEYKQDGKHRLGYNPAAETRDIFQEDFEAVRASGKRHNKASDWNQFGRKGGDRAALSKL